MRSAKPATYKLRQRSNELGIHFRFPLFPEKFETDAPSFIGVSSIVEKARSFHKSDVKLSLLHRGGALRDDTKNGCVADYMKLHELK